MTTIALIGNPNCGKTTLFNALTGARQRVGNWPGVTVEKREGEYQHAGQTINIIDMPGTYSLSIVDGEGSPDELIACAAVFSGVADVVVNVVDGNNLERNLYLTAQLLEMHIPVVVVVNMMDLAQKRGVQIDLQRLARELDCPVIGINAKHTKDCLRLKKFLAKNLPKSTPSEIVINYPKSVQQAQQQLVEEIANSSPTVYNRRQYLWLALRLLEQDGFAQHEIPQHQQLLATVATDDSFDDMDLLIADSRYQFIGEVLNVVVSKAGKKTNQGARLDKIMLNRWLGVPIFLTIMYLMFVFAINIAGSFQDFFDITSHTLLIDGVHYWLAQWGAPGWLISLLAGGIGVGISTTVTFIPVIGGMFLFLAFLEDSGYMARAAFVIDRLMRSLGLPGKAFVPLIVGFGCNVPSVMAARTLEHKRERILTIMMSPFMSCGARLAIFAVFAAAFFPQGGQNVVFTLYLIGIVFAVFTGFLLRHSLLPGETEPLILELPPYHMPNLRTVCLHAWHRLRHFLWRAGRLIIPLCVLLGALNSISVHGGFITADADSHSLLSAVGRSLTPIFSPMGLTQDNWPATVGLATGVLAKEVVVGTLNTLYMQAGHLSQTAIASFDVWAGLQEAGQSVIDNLSALGDAFINPIVANAASTEVNKAVYGIMYQRFGSASAAFAYLLFVLLYIPCVSTAAVIVRELNSGWAWFSVLWSTCSAYALAVMFYQIAIWQQHPLLSAVLIAMMLVFFVLVFFGLRFYQSRETHLSMVVEGGSQA